MQARVSGDGNRSVWKQLGGSVDWYRQPGLEVIVSKSSQEVAGEGVRVRVVLRPALTVKVGMSVHINQNLL